MPYYNRVLGTADPNISLDALIKQVERSGLSPVFGLLEKEQPTNWTQLLVSNRENGKELLIIERNPVAKGELGYEELEEFRESTPGFLPVSAATWLGSFFDRIKVIYAFQILSTVESDADWEIVSAVKSAIWTQTGGILQADAEGFSNEEGAHILWQFDDSVAGDYTMAVLQKGSWVSFVMQLEDADQRRKFLAGQVPSTAQIIA